MLKKLSEFSFVLPLLVMPMVIGKADLVEAAIIEYDFTALLENGDSISGTFGYDTLAIDQNPDSSEGEFNLLNWNINVNGTNFLKQDGETGKLQQSTNLQSFEFLNAPVGTPDRSQLFIQLFPFSGDPNVASELIVPTISSGFFAEDVTGNGGPPSIPIPIVTNSFQATQVGNFSDWNPLPPELPPMEYDAIFFDPDNPASWNWSQSFSDEIQDLFVTAPIHSVPYEPLVEYSASHDSFEASASFFSPGVYAATIDFVDDSVEDIIQFFYAGASASNNKCDTCKPLTHSRPTEIEHPGADLIIIDTQRAGDNKFVEIAGQILEGEQEAGNVQGAINLINQAFTNNGNEPVSVKIVGHGAGNIISIGGGQNPGAGQFLQNNNADVQNFINQTKGKISSLTLKGCCIAQGVDEPGRDHLMEVLADGLGVPVTSWDQTITAVPATDKRDGYFGVDVHGEEGTIQPVPEPSSPLSLLAIGIGGLGLTLKRKLKQSKSTENDTTKVG